MAVKAKKQPIEFTEKANGKVVEIKAQGTLTREDYETFVPRIEELIDQHGKIHVLFYMEDFRGWTAGALWDDIKFDAKHFNEIDRLALVGDKKWQEGMAVFCKPFTSATIRYFEHGELPAARQWVEEELPPKPR